MALIKELADAIARELSPQHYLHGWRPAIEAEIEVAEEDHQLEVSLHYQWDSDADAPSRENFCPCGKKATEYLDPRLNPPAARDLLEQVTGIDLGR